MRCCSRNPASRTSSCATASSGFTADEDAVAALSIALGRARVAFTALAPETASLEELFLGMTGGESSDHDQAEAVAV